MQSDELGQCIRAWRDRLDPGAAGLSVGARRRAPGLRREELAGLAGLSVGCLSRLEQGRATNPSPQVVAALARALRLSDEERGHLYLVAGQVPPGSGAIDRHLTPGVQRMVERLEEMAVWREFCGAPPSRFPRDAEENGRFRREMVADLRAAAGAYPEDEWLAALIADLRATIADFEELWARRQVAVRAASRKTLEHPEVGPITVDCDVLTVAASDLRLVVYSASPGTPDAEKLALPSVVGLQRMGG